MNEAFYMRKRGMTYKQIGEELGITRQKAYYLVQKAMWEEYRVI